MIIGKPPNKSGDDLSRDLAILQWLLTTLSILRSIMLTSSMIMIVFPDQSFLTREVIEVAWVRVIEIPRDVWNVLPPILSAADLVGAITITSSLRRIKSILA